MEYSSVRVVHQETRPDSAYAFNKSFSGCVDAWLQYAVCVQCAYISYWEHIWFTWHVNETGIGFSLHSNF